MADKLPNYKLEQERIKAKILSIEATVDRQKLEMAEMHTRAEVYISGIESKREEILELEEKQSEEDKPLEKQRIGLAIKASQHRVAQHRLGIMEMADRMDRYLVNVKSSTKAIDAEAEKLAGLEEAHGKTTEADFEAAIEKLTF